MTRVNNRKRHVIALMLVGARPEPYLQAALASLAPAVDFLVVNDNSQDPASSNREVLEACALRQTGKVAIVESPFVSFSDARNQCLRYIQTQVARPAGADTWILMIDADEVHGAGLRSVTRTLLPALSPDIGVVDGYFVQFMQCYDFFISLDRRHNLLFRLQDDVAWYLNVHERIRGLQGRRLCLPYVYYHYGYVQANQQILNKWRQYLDLGDGSRPSEALEAMDAAAMFAHHVSDCIPYRWPHPGVVQGLVREGCADRALADEGFRQQATVWLRAPTHATRATLRKANYRLRILWRGLQAPFFGVAPQAWACLARMALKPVHREDERADAVARFHNGG